MRLLTSIKAQARPSPDRLSYGPCLPPCLSLCLRDIRCLVHQQKGLVLSHHMKSANNVHYEIYIKFVNKNIQNCPKWPTCQCLTHLI